VREQPDRFAELLGAQVPQQKGPATARPFSLIKLSVALPVRLAGDSVAGVVSPKLRMIALQVEYPSTDLPPWHWRKNLIVISGGSFSNALRISSAAFANGFVSMLMPIPQPPQRM
jgi:hypothetical protein